MARNTIRQKTLHTDRRLHQSANGIGSIYDTPWSTLQNSIVFDVSKYESGVNIGNFQLKFNDGRNNDAFLHSNGTWLTPNSGFDCIIQIETGDKGKITKVSIENGGEQYKVGDRFSIIQLGGIDGLVEVSEIDKLGKVTEITIINSGKGYKDTVDGILLNDLYWTNKEIRRKDETEISEEIVGIPPQEWQLKLDWSFFNSFALYGSLTELIKSSFLNIVTDFPGSLWMVDGMEPNNPFNINIFTSDDDPYIDDIKVFQQNHSKYEVIDTVNFSYTDECSGNTYEEMYLTECRRDIKSIKPEYRYIYIKKNGYVGYVSPNSTTDANIDTHRNYQDYYTLDNNHLIVSNIDNEPWLTKQERYVTSGGSGYSSTPLPTVTISGGGGTGATAVVTGINDGIIICIKVENGGDGYTSIPTVTISPPAGGDGTTASAIAKISNGKVIHIDIIEKVDIGHVGDAYYKPIKLLDKIIIEVDKPHNNEEFSFDTCCNCGNDQTYTCNDNPLTFEIVFNYDDEYSPCTLINYKSEIFGNVNNVVGYHIRPKEEYIISFFKNLDDFQKRLLNQNSFPKYTSMFYIPDRDSEGVYNGMYVNDTFTINTLDGWNLDLTSSDYQEMIEKLMDAAEYLDNMKCDNIYRMLTHDSIKNLDWSLNRIEDHALAESYIIGETQLKKILRVYGRTYDEIKKYIQGIEIINNLTYDQLDNYPDGILRTEVETFGWKTVSIIDEYNSNIITNPLYYGWRQEYNSSDVESEFFRRLLLNSAHIMSWKGTKHGIEMLMNLFGIERNKWSLNELIYVAEGSSYGKVDNRSDKDTTMLPHEIEITGNNIFASYEYDVYSDGVGTVTYNGKVYYSGQSFFGVTGETTFSSTGVAQVFFNPIKNIEKLNYKATSTEQGTKVGDDIGNDPFAEFIEEREYLPICLSRYHVGGYVRCKNCNGKGIDIERSKCWECNGLGLVREYIGVPSFPGNSDRLYYQQFGGWYQDTLPELKFKQNISHLRDMVNNAKQSEGLIVFVKDDSEWKNPLSDDYSRYWVLINEDIPHRPEGWYNLTISETLTETTIETAHSGRITINIQAYSQVPSTNEGNNPHSGGTMGYDMGNSYLQHYGYEITKYNGDLISSYFNSPRGIVTNSIGLFNSTLEKTPECLWKESQFYLLEDVGFKLQGYIDNKGCWPVYRNEGYEQRIRSGYVEDPIIYETGKTPTYPILEQPMYNDDKLVVDSLYNIFPKTRHDDCLKCDHVWEENGQHNTRGVSLYPTEFYRIINCKNVVFTYNSTDDSDAYFFINTIIPYLEDLIPTNTIIELEFGKPILCGIGVMHIHEDICPPNCKIIEPGDQCEEEPGDRTAINRIAKIRNVPCGTIDNPC